MQFSETGGRPVMMSPSNSANTRPSWSSQSSAATTIEGHHHPPFRRYTQTRCLPFIHPTCHPHESIAANGGQSFLKTEFLHSRDCRPQPRQHLFAGAPSHAPHERSLRQGKSRNRRIDTLNLPPDAVWAGPCSL